MTPTIDDSALTAVFSALADPTRRAILQRLRRGEATVTELAQPFAMTLPAISKHLKVLERVGLISRGREAQWRPCRLEPKAMQGVTRWLDEYRQYWEESFDRLSDYLTAVQQEEQDR
jgi:DNA-binding transcriptional ArsR family regulator